jgi:Tfp pilus assembly protein PilX
MIVLAILGALGIAALDVADLNIFMAANDRDSKEAFFHADSGVNVGHEFFEEAVDGLNSTFFDSASDASTWSNSTSFNAADYPLAIYTAGTQGTYIRSGTLERGIMEGSAMQIGAGYEGAGKSAAHGGTYTNALIRSHREGQRNSRAEVDLGWRHIN